MRRTIFTVGTLTLLAVMGWSSATPTEAGKQEARDIATGLSVISAAGVVTPEPTTTAAGIGGLIGQGAGFIVIGIWDLFAAAPSSPDPDHGALASVSPVSFTPVPGYGPPFDNINDSLVVAGQLVDHSRLLGTTLRRCSGALQDGDLAHLQLQRMFATQLLGELEADQSEYSSILTAVSNDIQGTSFAALSTTVPEVLALRDEIVTSGFPDFEAFVFDEMQATADEIDLAIEEVAQATGGSLTDSDLTGAVIFDRTAQALLLIDIRELVPAECLLPRGGIAELPEIAASPLETAESPGGSSSPPYTAIAGAAAAAVVVVGASGWYARRRLS